MTTQHFLAAMKNILQHFKLLLSYNCNNSLVKLQHETGSNRDYSLCFGILIEWRFSPQTGIDLHFMQSFFPTSEAVFAIVEQESVWVKTAVISCLAASTNERLSQAI